MTGLRCVVPSTVALLVAVPLAHPGLARLVDRWTGRPTILAVNRRRAHLARKERP